MCCLQCGSMIEVKRELSESEELACPWCDSREVAPISYGAPTDELWKLSAKGKVVWGGCCVSEYSAQWFCLSCHREWGRLREERSRFCGLCGCASDCGICSDCNTLIMMDAARILEETCKEAERRERLRMIRMMLSGLMLVLRLWDSGSEGMESR